MIIQKTDEIGGLQGGPKTRTGGIVIMGVVAFLMLFCAGGSWLAMASLSGAVIARGSVIVEGEAKEVQHLEGGIVAAIYVADGQFVDEGDVVMRLDDTVAAANVDILQSRLQEAIARRSRLESERLRRPTILWPGNNELPAGIALNTELKTAQTELFMARMLSSESAQLRALGKISQYRSQIDGFRAQKTAHIKQLDLHREELSAMQKLLDQGHASEASLRELSKRLAFFEGEIGEAIAEEARARAAIGETEIALSQDEQEFAGQVLRDLASAETKIREVTQQLHAAQTQLYRTEIRAPSSGRIHKLSVVTVGGVVAAGTSLMQIVPQNRALNIAVPIEPHSIDEIRVGQPAVIRLSAFNQRQTEDLTGQIDTVSATTIVNEVDGRSYYRAIVSIGGPEAEKNQGVTLLPGMPVEVFLKTGDRSALGYLIKPVLDQFNRAMRER